MTSYSELHSQERSITLSMDRMLEIIADQAVYLDVISNCPRCGEKVKAGLKDQLLQIDYLGQDEVSRRSI